MPDMFSIREVTAQDDPAWPQITRLFDQMYDYMDQHGLLIGLAAGGAEKWTASVKKGLGRFGVLCISIQEGEVTGFAYGGLRLIPDYLGGLKTGVITHVHVDEGKRRSGTGKELVAALEDWFRRQDVHSVELQVISNNLPAKAFWEKLGYAPELVQYRKMKDAL